MSFCTTYQPGPAGSGELLLLVSTFLLALEMAFKAADAGHEISGLLAWKWKYESDITQKYHFPKSKYAEITEVVEQ